MFNESDHPDGMAHEISSAKAQTLSTEDGTRTHGSDNLTFFPQHYEHGWFQPLYADTTDIQYKPQCLWPVGGG